MLCSGIVTDTFFKIIKRATIENITNMTVGNNYINSFPDKFGDLKISVTIIINILIITKAKIGATFHVALIATFPIWSMFL